MRPRRRGAAGAGSQALAPRRPRHRHRHPGGPHGPAVPVVQPGRRLDDPALRRHRARPRDLEAPGRADGRDDRGRERGRARARRSTRARGAQAATVPARLRDRDARRSSRASGCSSSTTTRRTARSSPARRDRGAWTPVAVELPPQALELDRRAGEPFDVAVLDMQMPEMDGLALAHAIRRRRDEEACRSCCDLARPAAARPAPRAASRPSSQADQGLAALRRARERARRGAGRRAARGPAARRRRRDVRRSGSCSRRTTR